MSQERFTRGPWQLWKRTDPLSGKRGLVTSNEGKDGIAEIIGRIHSVGRVDAKEADANAALIAAAPELYAALELALATIDGSDRIIVQERTIPTIRAALAKARGEA